MDEETGLYYYGARYYDPKVSLWLSVDPLAEMYAGRSPYEYTLSNPVRFIDPTGMMPNDGIDWTGVEKNKDGTYTVVAGQLDSDRNIYVMQNGKRTEEAIGQSLTTHSFFYDDDSLISGAIIDPNDTSGINFLNK